MTAAFAAQPLVPVPCAAGPPLLAAAPAGVLAAAAGGAPLLLRQLFDAATGTGPPVLTPAWVAAHAAEVTLLDVSSAELPAARPLARIAREELPAGPLMRQVQIAAGALVLLGVILSQAIAPAWIALSAFVGAGLVFAGLSGFGGMARLLALMPWNRVTP